MGTVPDKHILLEYKVGSFRGEFPTVAVSDGIDIAALTEGDSDPFYVTLEIARVDEVSRNNLMYDKALVNAIRESVVGKGGIMGHIDKKERTTAFPIEQVDWVGVTLQDKSLWAKGYIPPGDTREYLRRLKARGGKLATSIYGVHAGQEFANDGTYTVQGFVLESVDLAPAERAALQLNGQFAVTAQMSDEDGNDLEGAMPTKESIIAELTASDIHLLPSAIREQIVADYAADYAAKGQAVVAELEKAVADRDTVIAELRNSLTAMQEAVVKDRINAVVSETLNWNVTGDQNVAKLDSLKNLLRSTIVSELGDKTGSDEITAARDAAWVTLKPIAETMRDAMSGKTTNIQNGNGTGNKLEDTPEAREKERNSWGI